MKCPKLPKTAALVEKDTSAWCSLTKSRCPGNSVPATLRFLSCFDNYVWNYFEEFAQPMTRFWVERILLGCSWSLSSGSLCRLSPFKRVLKHTETPRDCLNVPCNSNLSNWASLGWTLEGQSTNRIVRIDSEGLEVARLRYEGICWHDQGFHITSQWHWDCHRQETVVRLPGAKTFTIRLR